MQLLQVRHSILLTIWAIFLCSSNVMHAQPSKVEISNTEGNWSLLVNGKPYYINGAGGDDYLDVLVAAGGNTIRTWGTENGLEILNEAHKRGLKVMMGLWVQHERHGFDYNDEAKVKSQLENFRREIKKFKDHPALLLWGIGNEYELNYSNTKVWAAVNDIAKMVHEEDPNHPTSTVTAGTNSAKLKFIMEQMTEIDIYGINTYADVDNVKTVLKEGGFTKPYMITEWGPTGHWECTKTMWSSSVEQTSSEKASSYLARFNESIGSHREQSIGSFAFLWGQKQEYTATWYGLFTDKGIPTEAIDELTNSWSGAYPENRSPHIDSLTFNANGEFLNTIVKAGSKNEVVLYASDMNDDQLNYNWELYPESSDLKTGGDAEDKPPMIIGKIRGSKTASITLKAPMTEGRYRLYVFADDGEKMAYMNIPFYVQMGSEEEMKRVRFKSQSMKVYE